MRRLRWGIALVTLAVVAGTTLAQAQKDPLEAGKAAMEHEDYASAQKIFADYLQKNPKSTEAMLQLGISQMALRSFDEAISEFTKLLSVSPQTWGAHINLVLAYAQKGNWAAFAKERDLIKAARDSNAPGLPMDSADVIDFLDVGGQKHLVEYFYKPVGPHHTRYVFLHRVDGGVTDLITCDSDDGDQMVFKSEHPKEAAAGARRYSLDPWTVAGNNLEHGHILRFYDGEPTYEALRADVVKVLTANTQQKDRKSVR